MQNYHLVMLFIVIPIGKQLTMFCTDIHVYTCMHAPVSSCVPVIFELINLLL
jgi:hypothetical protein